jgi:hypothetical protein
MTFCDRPGTLGSFESVEGVSMTSRKRFVV